jgi:hypothetical protein
MFVRNVANTLHAATDKLHFFLRGASRRHDKRVSEPNYFLSKPNPCAIEAMREPMFAVIEL